MLVRAIVHYKNERLRSARINAGYKTIRALAEATGINEVILSEYEGFKKYPHDNKVCNNPNKQILETVLGVPADVLFDDEYKVAVDKKLGRRKEFVREVFALPSWANQEGFMLPEHEAESDKRDISKLISESIESLTEREGLVLTMHFGLGGSEELSLRETGQRLGGVTPERIHQIEAKALRKLKHPSRSRKLKSFINNH